MERKKKVTIYLDAVWLLNFLLDWMILLLTQMITRDNTRRFRIVIGAFVASIIVPITLFLPDSLLTTPFGKVIYSLFIILCAFGYRNIHQYFKRLLSFYFVSFSLGGGLIALHFLMGQQVMVSNSSMLTFQTGYGDQISWLFVGVGFPIIWLFTKSRMDKHALESFKQDQLFYVTIQLKGKSYTTTAYVDSGNQLVDPFTQKPVIICDQTFMSNWLSKEELAQLESAQVNLNFDNVPENWEHMIHIVPYQAVDGKPTFMIVLKPEKLHLSYEDKQISTNKLLIGLQFAELTSDGSYHCLLHPQLFKHTVATSA
ncbi:sigma-E processing peptidase SpoIIGA [Aquibacillus albus]|uniref:Stage II sporulation protein GA (Sporulation sigma-E factor processing peptidase) n=1 Tax=Aquibacillus albus TaxID=1168171 RepID=A0ABS2N0T3_9BACI|nr:sigma-E processing peptidase SpoIIGA [Aquibacillus albus]MBM7571742.1 stage II sporulation protein GA (sporulation sigma-E factor processing peptidase) [Aquibacillus albus]